jgi:hypothetical protein
MKFLDITNLFGAEPAHLAALSTFEFNPDFFERQLLPCSTLAQARRILVFMDAGQWFNLLRQDVRARFLNHRYLVVPVRPSQGVFHPKLNLLVREESGQVQCGSNNLTRSGCSSNLELLNSVSFTLEGESEEAILLAQEAYAFFKRACDDADQETGRIARQWLDELPRAATWLNVALPQNENRNVRLVHTYEGSLWDRLTAMFDGSAPKKIMVISPFHDADGEMAHRIHQRWPKCQIELVVQQQTTNLPKAPLIKVRSSVSLSELRNSSRYLHAKLLAWESSKGTGCLVGSANFTTAASDARNVETCFLVSDAEDFVASLFDKQVRKRPIAFEDFHPGTAHEPEVVDAESTSLRLTSALLTEAGELQVSYRHCLTPKPSSLRLGIRTPGEQRVRTFFSLPIKESGAATVIPQDSALMDAHGTILAFLVADVEDKTQYSPPIWIIQERRLTYEPTGEGSSSAKLKVEETGEDLTEFLEKLGERDGVAAVIEYLRHRLNIRFNDGAKGIQGGRRFRLRIRDPFHPDVAPEWLLQARTATDDLAAAIMDFADRHETQGLRKHARRGNINGMENFIDIFAALVGLLYFYHVRGFVHRNTLVGRIVTYLEVATSGIDSDNDYSEGYLTTLHDKLGSGYLQKVCDELNFLGHLRAALVIAQKVRCIWGAKRPSDCLPSIRDGLRESIKKVGLKEPSKQEVIKALDEYKIFMPAELAELEKEIVRP